MATIGFSEGFASLIATVLQENYGFTRTFEVLGCVLAIFTILYFTFCGMIDIFTPLEKKEEANIEEQKYDKGY